MPTSPTKRHGLNKNKTMKTFQQFCEDAGSGYSKDYEVERAQRRRRNPIQKRTDRSLAQLTYMLNRDR
jgi:hypothetical protein